MSVVMTTTYTRCGVVTFFHLTGEEPPPAKKAKVGEADQEGEQFGTLVLQSKHVTGGATSVQGVWLVKFK